MREETWICADKNLLEKEARQRGSSSRRLPFRSGGRKEERRGSARTKAESSRTEVEKDDGHRTHVVIVGVDFDVLEHVIRESRSLQNKRKDRNQFELQQVDLLRHPKLTMFPRSS